VRLSLPLLRSGWRWLGYWRRRSNWLGLWFWETKQRKKEGARINGINLLSNGNGSTPREIIIIIRLGGTRRLTLFPFTHLPTVVSDSRGHIVLSSPIVVTVQRGWTAKASYWLSDLLRFGLWLWLSDWLLCRLISWLTMGDQHSGE
jgi:hypothetical protein